jgi:hypothetical protein
MMNVTKSPNAMPRFEINTLEQCGTENVTYVAIQRLPLPELLALSWIA